MGRGLVKCSVVEQLLNVVPLKWFGLSPQGAGLDFRG